ncbi:MAG: RecX family transcriptional regulator [Nitrospira sp.]|nr:RecX family transcriptional regulator [Nitrospira sp.]
MKAPKRSSRSSREDWMPLGVRFLARRDRTVVQVERYLLSKGASPLQVRQIVRRLSDLSYLNDHAYAQRWIGNRLASRPMGRERLKAELQAKGIAETLADRVIADAFREADEEAVAHRALQTAQRHGRRLTRSQTMRLLRQRGFSEETIDRMIGQSRINEEPVYEE